MVEQFPCREIIVLLSCIIHEASHYVEGEKAITILSGDGKHVSWVG